MEEDSGVVSEIITIYRKMRKGRRDKGVYKARMGSVDRRSGIAGEDESISRPKFYNFVQFSNLKNTKYYVFMLENNESRLYQSDVLFEDKDVRLPKRLFWLNIFDPSEEDIRTLGALYGVHEMSIEDIRKKNTEEKVETFRNYTFISLKMMGRGGFRADTEDTDFNVLVFREFVITTHNKPWIGVNDAVNFLALLCRYTDFSSTWVVYSVVTELLQDIKHTVGKLNPEIWRNLADESNLESVLRANFDSACLLHSLKNATRPKRQILESMLKVNEFEGKVREVFLVALEDFRYVEDQIAEHIKTVERTGDLILALVDMQQTREANEINRIVSRFSIVTFSILPLQAISGVWGMNIAVPFKSSESLGPFVLLCMLGVFISALLLFSLGRRRMKRGR